MRIKMINYYLKNPTQIYAMFEYQKLVFEMVKNREGKSRNPEHDDWHFMHDCEYDKLAKITNMEKIYMECLPFLQQIDQYLLTNG